MTIITISRGTSGGGKELAKRVADQLGYRSFSREELLATAASEFGIGKEELAAAGESKPGLFQRVSLKRIQYIAYMRAALCKEVKKDNVVYHGQGGNMLIGEIPHVLRVRVIADMEFRIKAAVDQYSCDREKALKFIKKVDEDRGQWAKSLYGIDWQDPSLYDLVINLERIGVTTASDLVVTAARERFHTTPESQKMMSNLALSSEIRARIAANKGIEDIEVEIKADGDMVTIEGKPDSAAEAERIIRVVRETPGVREVTSAMRTRTSGRHHSMREFE
ncbi:MAG: cytidylate kinase family protein [Dehalococcoidia bacterium]|nr:cytidylate kinase family protein [Dehalococcoidia bacterium]